MVDSGAVTEWTPPRTGNHTLGTFEEMFQEPIGSITAWILMTAVLVLAPLFS